MGYLGDTPIGTTIFLDWVFFQARSPQLEPLDGRKGLTSGWIFLIVLYLFKEIFSKGWEEGENGGWKLEGWSNILFTEIPPIGTTGWKECVYGEWIFLIGLYLFKEIFSKGWEEGENGGWKL